MLVTVIPDAVEKGLTVYSNASVRKIQWQGRKAQAVHADVLDPTTDRPKGIKLTVKPKLVAVCGGALNTPALLLRSGLDHNGRVGQRTWLHPVVVMLARFEEQVNAFAGAPQSVYSHQFVERGAGKIGFFLEVPPIHPMLGATVATSFGDSFLQLFENLDKVQACIGITVDGLNPDEEGGTVRVRNDAYSRLSFDYRFTPAHWEAFRLACKEMAKIQFAAGAKSVHSLHFDSVTMTSAADVDKLDGAAWEKLKLRIVTAHQMGGCPLGKDPEKSVVDTKLRYHELDNLYVVDGSVFPTSLGVNPQLTIMGMSRWASTHIGAAVG
jgi:choline dehydrogenase-like flavoprotein